MSQLRGAGVGTERRDTQYTRCQQHEDQSMRTVRGGTSARSNKQCGWQIFGTRVPTVCSSKYRGTAWHS
eukprot:scaffold159154_cov17-Prasinocladus_malaysianus.AAC.1